MSAARKLTEGRRSNPVSWGSIPNKKMGGDYSHTHWVGKSDQLRVFMSTMALLSLGTVFYMTSLLPSPHFWPLPQKRTVGETIGTLAAASFEFTCDQPAVPVLTRAFKRYTKLCVHGGSDAHELAGDTNVLEALDVQILSNDEILDLKTVRIFLDLKQVYGDVSKWSNATKYPPALRRRKITR